MSMRGHCVFVLAKLQFCNRPSIFSLCFMETHPHLLELGFASLKGNSTQTRRAIASVTSIVWGPYGISLSFIAQNTIFVYTLPDSIIISGDIASYFLEILMIRYL